MILGQQRIEGVPRSILLIQLGDIGDVVLTTPCLQALRKAYPAAYIAVAVRDKAAELIEDSPWVDEVFAVGRGKGFIADLRHQLQLFRLIRKRRWELAIDLRTGTRGAIMAFLSGAKQRLSFHSVDGPWWRNRIFSGLLRREYVPTEHVIDYLLGLLAAFGVPATENTPCLTVSESRAEEAQRLLASESIAQDRPLVAVQPFSLWQYKEWGEEKFVELIRWLIGEFGVNVVVTGSLAERDRAREIVARCGAGCYSLAGKTSIALYAPLLQCCKLFIGVDSAGVHIAAAVGTPTVSIYGPSSPVSWAPRGDNHLVVQKDFDCVPCRQKGCEGSEKSRCLEELAVSELQKQIKI